MEAEAEATMICVDNGRSMIKPMFEEQADAVRFYCTEKLNANPKNVVGIASMSRNNLYVVATPTRDISTIMAHFYDMPLNGRLLLRDAVFLAESVLREDLNDKDLKKRIVVFAGGDIYDSKDDANRLGLWLKKHDIACDAVNFGHQSSSNKREVFETLVAAAQNKGNSHILHVDDDTSVSEALSSSPIIPTRVGPPPELKNKQHYLQNPYVGTADLISITLEWMWENAEHINAAAKARRIAEAAEAEYYLI